MALIKTMAEMCDEELRACEFRLTMLGGGCVYAEGVRSIKSMTDSEIVLGLKKSCMKISGRELKIDKLLDGDAIIKGRVERLERTPV